MAEEAVLNVFKRKIEDAVAMVQAMDAEEKLEAVHYWNVVSERLQDIVNHSVEDISALAFQMEGEKSGLPDYIDASQLVPLGMAPSFMTRYITNTEESTTTLNGKLKELTHINGHLIVTDNVPGLELLPNYEVQQVAVEVENIGQEQQVASEEVVMNAEEALVQNTGSVVQQTSTAQLPISQDASLADPVAESFFTKVIRDTVAETEEADESNTVHLMIAADSQVPVSKETPFQPNVLRRGRRVRKKGEDEDIEESDADDPGFECEYCQRIFCTASQLTTHTWTHTKPYTCSDCQARFSTKGNLIVHRRRHSGEKPFFCPKCEACFSTKGNLKRHLKSHSGEKPWQCTQCGSRFTEKKSLKVHMRRHTGERPYKCAMCMKAFSQTSILQSHMAMHLNQREHLCNQCGKSFRQKSQLRLHEQRHAGLRKYQCSVCPYKFLTKGDMERHRRIHTGERPYVCKECGKTFTRQQSLNEHMNRHLGLKPYQCKYCRKGFVEMSACYKHIKVHEKSKGAKSETAGESVSNQPAPDAEKHKLVANQEIDNAEIILEEPTANGEENTENTGFTICCTEVNKNCTAPNASPLRQLQMLYNYQEI